MVAELLALTVLLFAGAAELLHRRRIRHMARLAFGPTARPRLWARAAPFLRVLAMSAMAWGLTTLALLKPMTHQALKLDENQMRHLLLVLDVSPSMRLEDAGPSAIQSRRQRAHDLMKSFFQRTDASRFWITIVAVYNGAKPVVLDTTDFEVVTNIFDDLPMEYAFHVGETRLFDGLEQAARIARPWPPRTGTLLLISDGDTVPATGMPKMPASISHALVVGVGDPHAGSMIDGRQSRQDVSTLRQVSVRLGGLYHDGNDKHIPTDTLLAITRSGRESRFARLTRREYALAAVAAGALVYAALPLLLHLFGTGWRPGVPLTSTKTTARRDTTFTQKEFAQPVSGTV